MFRYPQVHSCCKPCQNHVAHDPLHVLSLLAKLGVSERPRGTPADALIGTARLRYYAEVDSGADHCAFPLSFASQLGLDPLTNTNVTSSIGVGGSAPTFYWNATMVFGTVLSLDAYVRFTSGLEQQGMGLLGQCGFLDRVKVLFDHHGGVFHIETPAPPQPPSPTITVGDPGTGEV